MLTPITTTQKPGSKVELAFSVTPEEAKPWIDQAVIDLSTHRPIQGFRPGKASYDTVKRTYGEMAILETAFERVVRALYVKAVLAEQLETIGSPEVSAEKITPGASFDFKATATILPQVTKLPDYQQPRVTKKNRDITDTEVDAAINDLRRMRRTEIAVDRASTSEDLVEVDLDILKDHVLVEGGSAKGYRVALNESHYIPGFAEKLIGLKKGEEKTFELPFPADHYNKALAGKDMEFHATVKDVFELTLAELNEDFAKGFGMESVDALKSRIRENLQQEASLKASESAEIELLESLTKDATFSEIPDLLINEEVVRMLKELEHNVESQGGKLEDYLSSIKKSRDELKLEFVPQALQRIQTAILIKTIAKKEQIEVTDEEADADIDRILDSNPTGDADWKQHVISPDYRDYVMVQIRNRKVLNLLKEKGITEKA